MMPSSMGALFESLRGDPYPIYRQLRQSAPVHQVSAAIWTLARFADVEAALKSPRVFSSRVNAFGTFSSSDSLLGTDPPEHTHLRSIVNRAFAPRYIALRRDRIVSLTEALLAEIAGRSQYDLIRDVAEPVPIIVIAEMLGADPERWNDFKRWSQAAVAVGTGISSGHEADSALADFQSYLQEQIERRRQTPGDDLISTLVLSSDGALTPSQLVNFVALLLIAGNETTTKLIGNTLHALFAFPDVMSQIREAPETIDAVVEESLRFEPPVQFVRRQTTREVDVSGVSIPANQTVLLLLGSANRDEARFASPDAYMPERKDAGHIALGGGPHFCLGASLTRLEAREVLKVLSRRLPALRLVDTEKSRPVMVSIPLRGPRSLVVQVEPEC